MYDLSDKINGVIDGPFNTQKDAEAALSEAIRQGTKINIETGFFDEEHGFCEHPTEEQARAAARDFYYIEEAGA